LIDKLINVSFAFHLIKQKVRFEAIRTRILNNLGFKLPKQFPQNVQQICKNEVNISPWWEKVQKSY